MTFSCICIGQGALIIPMKRKDKNKMVRGHTQSPGEREREANPLGSRTKIASGELGRCAKSWIGSSVIHSESEPFRTTKHADNCQRQWSA